MVSLNEELEFYSGVRPFSGAKFPKFKVLNSKNSLFIRKQAPPKKTGMRNWKRKIILYTLGLKLKGSVRVFEQESACYNFCCLCI